MDRTLPFRRSLLSRLMLAVVVTAPVAAVTAGGCGSVVTEPIKSCFAWPPAPLGSGGASVGTGGAGGGAGVDPNVCPTPAGARQYLGYFCGTVVSNGILANGQCCYEVVPAACGGITGRPFLEAGVGRTAPVRRLEAPAGAWHPAREGRPAVDHLDRETRAALAAAWTADASLEHASIASFGRFALELMAVGAPADLVADAHRAALDEVEHARLCFGLASAYAGETLSPAPFPFGGRVEVSADLATIAARAAREGCIGETLGAVQAAEQLAAAEDPAVRAALTVIVEDEARHAELAWRFVAWALAAGGEGVRAAVAAAFAGPISLPSGEVGDAATMAAHGRVSPTSLGVALGDVVRPCVAHLLGSPVV